MKKRIHNSVTSIIIMVLMIVFLGALVLNFYYKSNTEQKRYNMVLIPKAIDSSNAFWSSVMEGGKLGAKEYNINLQIMGVYYEQDVEGQIEQIEKAIEQKPDAIAIAPADSKRTAPALKEAKEKGIKIILIDSLLVDETIADCVITTNNIKAGKELGEYAKKLVEEDDEIVMVGHVKGTSTAIQREEGMRKGLGEYEKNIKEVIFSGSSYEQAFADTMKAIDENPNLKLIMGMNEYSAVGAARAVEATGNAGKIKMVGFDNSLEEIQMLERGVFDAIIIQKPVNMGYLSIEKGVKILNRESYNKNYDSGSTLINRGNMYLDENQRLLYPFTGKQ
ncbi:MAG TPA: substrate-binding domain-containing protein [Candidatus Dorea intestinavium]|nr:substrate-binding domain-containing protein [Candidatus Dorea intestinavium]